MEGMIMRLYPLTITRRDLLSNSMSPVRGFVANTIGGAGGTTDGMGSALAFSFFSLDDDETVADLAVLACLAGGVTRGGLADADTDD